MANIGIILVPDMTITYYRKTYFIYFYIKYL